MTRSPIAQEVPLLPKGKFIGVHASIVFWLAAVPLLLLGCLQPEVDPNPTAIPMVVPTAAVPTAAPSPTPSRALTQAPAEPQTATATAQPTEEQKQRETVTEMPETIDDEDLYEGWGTYTDAESGYFLRVPLNWISKEFIEPHAHDYFKVAFGPSDGILMYIGEEEAYKVYEFGCSVVSVKEIPSKFSLEGTIGQVLDARSGLEDAERTEILVGSLKAVLYDESIFPFDPRDGNPQLDGLTTFVKYGDVVLLFTGLSCESKKEQFENQFKMMLGSVEFLEVTKQDEEEQMVDTATWPLYTHPELGYSLKMHPDFQEMGDSERFLVLADENKTCRHTLKRDTGKWIVAELDINIFPYENSNFNYSKEEVRRSYKEALSADANSELIVQDTRILKIANFYLDGRLLPQVLVGRNTYVTSFAGEQQAFHFELEGDCLDDVEKYRNLLNAAFATFRFNNFNP